MQILKVISLLLDYPTEQLLAGRDELDQAIAASREISPEQRNALHELLELICENDLMDGQEHYGALFGRGRALSLLLSRTTSCSTVDSMSRATTPPCIRWVPNPHPLAWNDTFHQGR